MGGKKIKDVNVLRFAENIRRNYKADKVILFGSRAREDFLLVSDYDIIVVSDAFKNKNYFERAKAMYKFWDFKKGNLDVLCFTNSEFEKKKKQIGIVGEAVRKGIAV